MFPKTRVIKKTARESLNGNWAQIMLSVLLAAACCILPVILRDIAGELIKSSGGFIFTRDLNAAAGVFTAVYFFFLADPLLLGLLKIFWIITAGQRPELYTLFEFFTDRKSYRLALKAQLAVLWRVAVAAAVCMLPYLVLLLGQRTGLDKLLGVAADIAKLGLAGTMLSLGESVFSVVLVFILISFMPLPFVIINRPDLPLRDLVADTKRIYRLYSKNFVVFIFSFIGWLFSSVFILPMLFALPFFLASWAVLVRFSIFHASRAHTA